jgi:predicted O-methyltransferase YrrM
VPPEAAGKIRFMEGDSQTLDFSPFYGTMDLVFVDGSHEFAAVRQDARTAANCVRPGGIVLFHDAAPSKKGVIAALRSLDDPRLCRIENTTVAFWQL